MSRVYAYAHVFVGKFLCTFFPPPVLYVYPFPLSPLSLSLSSPPATPSLLLGGEGSKGGAGKGGGCPSYLEKGGYLALPPPPSSLY
jgi:hypothetical protein